MRLFKQILYYNKILYRFMEGKRTKQSEGGLIQQSQKLGGSFTFGTKPQFLQARLKQFAAIKNRIDQIYKNVEKPQITIKLKDGSEKKGQAFLTTPYQIAKGIKKDLAESSVVAKVKYIKKYQSPFGKGIVSAQADDEGMSNMKGNQFELLDMTRPLQGDCELELISFEQKEGKQVFWHSSAHLLGQSLQMKYGAWLCHGPPLQNGFFYDSFVGDYHMTQDDYIKIEQEIDRYVKQKQPYERILLTKKQALEMFSYNPFKTQLIQNKIPEDGLTSAYRCGNLIDLCTGPHISSAQRIKGFKVTKNSSAYWLGKKQNDNLQRIYAVSYPKKAQLQQYLKMQAQLLKRDHRTIGPKQGLFNFTTLSPGCALFYPHGTIIYNRLIQLMRSQYKIRGYSEVLSPNIYNSELWKMSGHYFKYKQNIYFINVDEDQYGLKPMNCPGHCIMFDLYQRSYRDLPLRMADFGVLHRNQLHGALSGLTRVRRFQQDDAHIFCMPQQLQDQILGCLDLLDYIYSIFDFKYEIELSTRPQKYLGKIQEWDIAQNQLLQALKKFGKPFKINPGDGAFYGPKIDVKLFDLFGREFQCGTVQCDFQLPLRFNLQFRSKENKQQKPIEQKQQVEKKQDKKDKKKKEFTEQQREALRKERNEKKKLKELEKQQGTEKKQQQVNVQKKAEQVKVQHPKKQQQSLEAMQQRYNIIGHLKNGFSRPVIVHRAIFGSMERFIAILCQHTGGKWPFWVSPRQIQVIPISKDCQQYAEKVYNTLILNGYAASIDNSGDQLNKKVRNAQMDSFNYIGVVGAQEMKQNTIKIRQRDQQEPKGTYSIPDLLKMFEELKPPKSKKRQALQKLSFVK